MLRKLILAGATLAAVSTPALSAEWYIVRSNAPAGADESACIVVDRKAAMGEQGIAGPFASQHSGLSALGGYAACGSVSHTTR